MADNTLIPIVIEKSGRGERAYDIYSRLLKDRIIIVGGGISDESANTIIAQMLFLSNDDPRSDIQLYVNSPGGSVSAGLGIIDTMRFLRCDVATTCIGMAASMGAALLSAGTRGKRAVLQNSQVMLHQPLIGGVLQGPATDLGIEAAHMLRLRDRLYKLMADYTGKTPEQIHRDFDRNKWLFAEEAVEYGCADRYQIARPNRRERPTTGMTKTKRIDLLPPMKTDGHRFRMSKMRFIGAHLCLSVAPFLLLGCTGKPDQANIELRKQNQTLTTQLEQLQRQHDADAARIKALESEKGTLPTLPEERLARLFTTHGIRLNRLTGGADLDANRTGDDAVKVYVVPTDDSGNALKAAGSFVVELFDLSKSSDNLVGRWEFSVEQARESWLGSGLLYEYVLTAPFSHPPAHSELTLKVTFHDELTQREFSAQKVISVKLQ